MLLRHVSIPTNDYTQFKLENNSADMHTSFKVALSFEERISNLVCSLIDHINSRKCTTTGLSTDTQPYLSKEQDERTVLHLCADLGYKEVFNKLVYLKETISYKNIKVLTDLQMITNELSPFSLDIRAEVPITIAARKGHTSISFGLLKMLRAESELHGQLKWTESVIASIEKAKFFSCTELSENLNQLLNETLNQKTIRFDSDFPLVEALDDLNSFLTDQTVVLDDPKPEEHTLQTIVESNQADFDFGSKAVLNSLTIANDSQQNLDTINLNFNNQLSDHLIHQNTSADDYQNFISDFESTINNIDQNETYNIENAQILNLNSKNGKSLTTFLLEKVNKWWETQTRILKNIQWATGGSPLDNMI